MARPGLADQQELLRWADTVGARSELPRLIRRLVLETGAGVTALDFPAAEGTAMGGWDGVAYASEAAPFVPVGLSLWELTVESSVNKKADADYVKRLTTPDGSLTTDATYCAVAARRWRDRRKWAETKKAGGRWRDVRAHGIDDLETWLDSAPVTHAWISEQLGLKPYGMRTADAWWASWSEATIPGLTMDVVLAGRSSEVDDLRQRLTGRPQVVTLRAGSRDEALAAVAALGLRDDADDRGALLARTVFVDDVSTWRALADHKRPLVLVARTPEVIEEAESAPRHHVLVPLTGTARADVVLPEIDIAHAALALTAGGLSEQKADEASRLGRRSLLTLRRHLARKPELHQPPWAVVPVDRVVRGIVLAGAWNDDARGDQVQLAELAGKPYDDLREDLSRLAAAEDPLITRVDRSWAVASPFDAWQQLQTQLRPDDLRRFGLAAQAALLQDDPMFGLSTADQLRASFEGTSRSHSAELCTGLATTVALLGSRGNEVDGGGGMSGTTFASAVVRQALGWANDASTIAAWASLSSDLPLLAEGGPDSFLDGVRAGLSGTSPILGSIFTDGETADLFFSSSPHASLLWALERLAWSPEHFAQSVHLLVQLAELDPGGQLSNRPLATLTSIFCPWHPGTVASILARLDVLDRIRQRSPTIAWRLLLSLLPDANEILSPTAEPRFHDWKPAEPVVTHSQFVEFVRATVGRLIEDANCDSGRWQRLIDESDRLAPEDRSQIRDELKRQVAAGSLGQPGREALWESLRSMIARHREFSDTDWALPPEDLDALEAIKQDLAPQDVVATRAWLFGDHMPDLGNSKLDEHGEYDHVGYTGALADHRRRAVHEVAQEAGWDGVLRLASHAALPWAVGFSLAETDEGEYEASCLPLVDAESWHTMNLATGYFASRFIQDGWTWLDEVVADDGLSPNLRARLLLCTQDYPSSWIRADTLGSAVAMAYWALFMPLGLGPDYPYIEVTSRRLTEASRPAVALQLIAQYASGQAQSRGCALAAAAALDKILHQQHHGPAAGALRAYDVQTIVDLLEAHGDDVGANRLAGLEWAYLGALGSGPRVPSLQAGLSDDPAFFVAAVSAVYRRRSGPSTPPTPEQERVARNARLLLASWKRLPGTGADGSIDGRALLIWVSDAVPLLDEADRRSIGEECIGKVLAAAPSDPDASWPCVAVRDLLEEVQSDHVEQGFQIQIANNRGATWRDPEDGGDQERALAKKYAEAAKGFADRWPRTAAVFRGLATGYEQDARRNDGRAERRRKGLDT